LLSESVPKLSPLTVPYAHKAAMSISLTLVVVALKEVVTVTSTALALVVLFCLSTVTVPKGTS